MCVGGGGRNLSINTYINTYVCGKPRINACAIKLLNVCVVWGRGPTSVCVCVWCGGGNQGINTGMCVCVGGGTK